MSEAEPHVGKRFNRWTVVTECAGRNWLCRCDCGVERTVSRFTLKNGRSKSCGCLHNELTAHLNKSRTRLNLIGRRVGLLTVVAKAERPGKGQWWLCKCDCGGEVVSPSGVLCREAKASCGCLVDVGPRVPQHIKNRRRVEQVTDGYARQQLSVGPDFPKEFIEAKRDQLFLRRLERELKQVINELEK